MLSESRISRIFGFLLLPSIKPVELEIASIKSGVREVNGEVRNLASRDSNILTVDGTPISDV